MYFTISYSTTFATETFVPAYYKQTYNSFVIETSTNKNNNRENLNFYFFYETVDSNYRTVFKNAIKVLTALNLRSKL